MHKGFRSICLWHCQCVCINYPEHAIPCKPMLVEDYNLAGFIGHLPISTSFPCTITHTTVVFILRGVFGVIVFLLLLGEK